MHAHEARIDVWAFARDDGPTASVPIEVVIFGIVADTAPRNVVGKDLQSVLLTYDRVVRLGSDSDHLAIEQPELLDVGRIHEHDVPCPAETSRNRSSNP